MSPQRLDISRLGPSGEVIRKITCLAGRVTAFRANSESEFDLYRSALAGWKTSERFSILVDDSSFTPAKHALIGFGEAYAIERGNDSLKKVLIESGIEASQIEAALLSFGLGGLADAPCKALSPAQERLLRILASTARPDHVLILYEPFEVLPEAWRETAADMLARFAWEKKAIVVVVKLTSRPECWIENEHIARVQLERPRKRTIGFGADSGDTAALVAQVRRESAAINLQELRRNPTKTLAQAFIQKFQDSRLFGYSVVILVSFSISAVYFTQTRPFPRIESDSSGRQQLASTSALGHEGGTISRGSAATQSNRNPDTARPSKDSKKSYVLDGYEPDLKEAIVLAFSNPDEVLERQRAAVSLLPAASQPAANAVRNVHIEAAPEYPQGIDPMIEGRLDEMSLEARREEIRRRFLAAVQANQ